MSTAWLSIVCTWYGFSAEYGNYHIILIPSTVRDMIATAIAIAIAIAFAIAI